MCFQRLWSLHIKIHYLGNINETLRKMVRRLFSYGPFSLCHSCHVTLARVPQGAPLIEPSDLLIMISLRKKLKL